MDYDEFITRVAGRADVNLETASKLTEATLWTLAQRISGGEFEDLAKYLPEGVRGVYRAVPEPAEAFDVAEFDRRVAEHSGTSTETAEAGIRAVFATMAEPVPEREIEDVKAQLPPTFHRLFASKD